MTQKKLRKILRWMHIVLGLVVMCYIYSPFHEHYGFQVVMKFVIIPVITLSGVYMWKFKELNKFFKNFS